MSNVLAKPTNTNVLSKSYTACAIALAIVLSWHPFDTVHHVVLHDSSSHHEFDKSHLAPQVGKLRCYIFLQVTYLIYGDQNLVNQVIQDVLQCLCCVFANCIVSFITLASPA